MIGLNGIKQQAERWWPDFLKAQIRGDVFFPRALQRIGKVKSSERLHAFERIRSEQNLLVAHSKDKKGYGYTLHWKETVFRNVGRNRFIDAITFETSEDYLQFMGREAGCAHFKQNAQLILGQYPQLTSWCEQHVLAIIKHQNYWPELLRVADYFLERHEPGRYYVRELPLELPSKFVEQHEAILRKLLDALLPPERIYEGKKFTQRYGLKCPAPLLRLRVLDTDLAQQYFGGLTDLSLPLTDVAALSVPFKRVIVVENKTSHHNLFNFLTLPQCRGALGVFGSGYRVGLLREITWLSRLHLYYWGDLDAAGLQILSRLRTYHPHTQAFLMDRATFEAHAAYHTNAAALPAQQLPGLHPDELALYHYLNEHQLRLEQEFIPQATVVEALRQLMAAQKNDN